MSAKPFKIGDRVRIRKGDTHVVSETLENRPFVTIHEVIGDGSYYRVTEGLRQFPTHSMSAERFENDLYVEGIRAGTQLAKVRDYALDKDTVTLAELSCVTLSSEAAVSARLRDLRALGYDVLCVKRKGEKQRRYTVRTKEVATA